MGRMKKDSNKKKKEKINVTLDPDLIEYIDMVSEDLCITRSAALNYILRKVMKNGL